MTQTQSKLEIEDKNQEAVIQRQRDAKTVDSIQTELSLGLAQAQIKSIMYRLSLRSSSFEMV